MSIQKRIEDTIKNLLITFQYSPSALSDTVLKVMEMVGSMFVPISALPTWRVIDIICNEQAFMFYWVSISETACCPHCNEISNNKSNT